MVTYLALIEANWARSESPNIRALDSLDRQRIHHPSSILRGSETQAES
jgi:hypothetical protein